MINKLLKGKSLKESMFILQEYVDYLFENKFNPCKYARLKKVKDGHVTLEFLHYNPINSSTLTYMDFTFNEFEFNYKIAVPTKDYMAIEFKLKDEYRRLKYSLDNLELIRQDKI